MATFNTTDPKPGYVYEVATDTWFPIAGIAPGSSVDRWRKTAVGSETSVSGLDDLSVTLSYEVGTEQVYLNGVLLVRTSDYTATNGTSITGLSALAANDVVEVISFNPVNIEKTDAILSTAINAKGDLIAGSADNTPSILTVGTNGYVLAASSAAATGLVWTDSAASTQTLTNKTIVAANNTLTGVINNTLTSTTGDIIYASAANTPARLPIGSTSQVLTVASGIPSWATLASSKVLQVVSASTSTATSGTTSYVDSGITATITPTLATSKILIFTSVCSECTRTGSTNVALNLQLRKGATTIANYDTRQWNYLTFPSSGTYSVATVATLTYMDSPATTSATTYSIRGQGPEATSSFTFQPNSGPSTIVLMEIGA